MTTKTPAITSRICWARTTPTLARIRVVTGTPMISRKSITATTAIAATKTGLLLKGVTGYGINPVNGNFSGGASGFWIENGKIAFPVRGLTIAGTAEEILNGIDLVADDLDMNRSMGAPTLRVELLQIGGE